MDLLISGKMCKMIVYDLMGREVATLFDGTQMAGSRHEITWNASNQASGVYILRMTAGNYTTTQKLTLEK